MPTKLIVPFETCIDYVDKLPEDITVVFVDERVRRASELKPGDKIVDCNFQLVEVREIEQEIAQYAIVETEEFRDVLNQFRDIEAELEQHFRECRKSYKINDIVVHDTNGRVHSFVNCCHFEDEHAEFYPDIPLG